MEARTLSKSPPHSFQLSLRVRHPSMDPVEISRELQLEAEHSFRAGQRRKSSSGTATATVHAESYWLATLDPVSWPAAMASFEIPSSERQGAVSAGEALQEITGRDPEFALTLATRFLRTRAEFVRRVQVEGGEVGLLVELSPKAGRGFTLTPHIARALSELNIAVDFEFANG